jgi:hypothetical protein
MVGTSTTNKFELKGWEHSGQRAVCNICGWQDKFVDFAIGEEGDHHLQICRECIEAGNLDAKLEEEAAKEIASIAKHEASATKRAAFLRSLRGRLEVRVTEKTSVHDMGESWLLPLDSGSGTVTYLAPEN